MIVQYNINQNLQNLTIETPTGYTHFRAIVDIVHFNLSVNLNATQLGITLFNQRCNRDLVVNTSTSIIRLGLSTSISLTGIGASMPNGVGITTTNPSNISFYITTNQNVINISNVMGTPCILTLQFY